MKKTILTILAVIVLCLGTAFSAFAEGEVPTVRGAIRFRWENGKLKIRVPENIRCEVDSKYETEVP